MSAGTNSGARSIRLVVFDLGRVLIRICRDWQHACECAGFDGSSISPQGQLKLHEALRRGEIGQSSADDVFAHAAAAISCSPEQVRGISEKFILGTYPGVPELLDELSSAGVKTACLSNTNEHHWSLMFDPAHRAFLPMDRLSHRFASHLMRARKPDEEIYAQVEREVRLPGNAILFFDDVMENIEAARLRGWNAEWIDPAPDAPLPQIRAALQNHRVL